ncbi:nucleoside deaminase [Falsiroseomonas sp.]|uniref:nucleoside deaminase n=1 Tax=Falsiroseomonas sp. TaxID=2870721 RepID=UPI00271F6C8B|nr:nucleoside deaminase [Falsiroseomonas sp.]MDO9500251.1 nucleoside deaminase [Falsiroseomonas sp.]
MTDEDFMRHAIALSRRGMAGGAGGPFGAVVVLGGQVVAEGWNQVTSTLDPTAHAEIVAIRRACTALGRFDLRGATVFTSCEPCPMCLAALYWSRCDRVVYANDRVQAAGIGFDDEFLYQEIPKPIAARSLPMQRLLAAEALEVFAEWTGKPDRVAY